MGFRDDREVMVWYGLCPDCGTGRSDCLCRRDRLFLDDDLRLVDGRETAEDRKDHGMPDDCPF